MILPYNNCPHYSFSFYIETSAGGANKTALHINDYYVLQWQSSRLFFIHSHVLKLHNDNTYLYYDGYVDGVTNYRLNLIYLRDYIVYYIHTLHQ